MKLVANVIPNHFVDILDADLQHPATMTVDNNNSPVTCHEGFDLDNDKASLAALINSIGNR